MIEAKHNIFAEILYRKYLSRLFKSNFGKIFLINEFPDIKKCIRLIVTPNHFSWWDGFFIEFAMRKFTDRKLHILMLEDQLRKYRFLQYLGAFSINQESVSSVSESLKYAKKITESESNYLAFYPQGEIQNYERKFVSLKRGLISVASDDDAKVLIVTFKIVYGNEKKPDVYFRFHDELVAVRNNDEFKSFESIFLNNIDLLDNDAVNKSGTDILNS